MKKYLIFLIIAVALVTSCSSKTSLPQEPAEEPNISEPEETEPTEEEEPVDPRKVVSPLDGMKYYPEELERRVVAVSLDNHPEARWQSGLKDAEIVYEFQVEYPYTRYLAIFLAKEPKLIGPVRSARPYIIYYAMENDAIFVHVGGSEDAFSEIKRLRTAEIDGLYSGAMWRYYDTGKYAPHNMYTTLKSIRDEAERKGFRAESTFEAYSFNEKKILLSEKHTVMKSESINITYNKNNTTDYTYDVEEKLYLRSKDGEKHIDELDGIQLKTENIIALEAPKSVLDNAGRLYLASVGKGKGIYFTEGEAVEISWEKGSEKDRTKFYVGNEELVLNPGNTWIQIVDGLSAVTFK